MSRSSPLTVTPTTNATLRTSTAVKAQADPQLSFGSSLLPAPLSRLGRLRDAAYKDWPTFVQAAEKRLGVKFVDAVVVADSNAAPEADSNADVPSVRYSSNKGIPPALLASLPAVENLHVLRCLLGPAVESLLLLDRLQWVLEELESEADPTGYLDPALEKACWEDGPYFSEKGIHQKGLRICHSLAGVHPALVNLFDQATGSGRNVALVVADMLP